MKMILRFIFVAVALLVTVPNVYAKLSLPSVFADHMVLQRDKPVSFWGEAEANQKITVSVQQQSVSTQSNAAGEWRVDLPAQTKGGPYTVVIQSQQAIELKDVYFGDVWIASGQSNMEWKLDWDVNNKQQELLDSQYPQIRF